ncbi:nucleotide pyrophosphohydrolase [Streptomyces sp. NPDC088725]|uniref:nucleotide pyrophosphohydrolase n=1 Tax=Streptomyces sp. NPDC088725 TaxID=3365873 RepID=UPI003817F550
MTEQSEGPERSGQRGQPGPPGGSAGPGRPELPELTVAGLQRRLVEFAAARDWGPFHTPKNLAAALSVEASELLEIFQWLTPEQSARVMEDPESAHRVNDEVADVLAYLLQFCDGLGVDVLAALAAKIERNEVRFPRKTSAERPSNPSSLSPCSPDPGSSVP